MGLSFRKSFNMGPLRVNLSGAGVGVSAGVRGARVAVGPRGTYVTLSAGGFRYQRKLDSSPQKESPAVLPSPSVLSAGAPEQAGYIATASVGSLMESSPEDSLEEIQRRVHRSNLFMVYLVLALPLLFYILSLELPWLLLGAGVVLGAGAIWVYQWDCERRTARIIYDVDSPELLERFALCNAAGEALGRAARLWHIYFSIGTQDQKRNAGATNLIRRTRVLCVPRPLPLIECNIQPWSIPVGPQQLLFLPDRILVQEGKRLAGVPYSQLTIEASATKFIEEEPVPADARTVGTTWRFVNKSGGPDRRFNNNRQLPILAYGEVLLRSARGMNIVIQSSNIEAAEATKSVLDVLCRLSREATGDPSPHLIPEAHAASVKEPVSSLPPVASSPVPSPPVSPLPAAAPSQEQSQLQSLELATKAAAVATVLRYIAVADRRFTPEEKERLETAVREVCAGDVLVEAMILAKLPELRSDASSVTEALDVLRSAEPALRARVWGLATEMAGADGSVTPKEKERLAEISAALRP